MNIGFTTLKYTRELYQSPINVLPRLLTMIASIYSAPNYSRFRRSALILIFHFLHPPCRLRHPAALKCLLMVELQHFCFWKCKYFGIENKRKEKVSSVLCTHFCSSISCCIRAASSSVISYIDDDDSFFNCSSLRRFASKRFFSSASLSAICFCRSCCACLARSSKMPSNNYT